MINVNDVWVEKSTGEQVVIDWVSSELVSYLKPSAEKMVRTERKFVFMQLFDNKSALLNERMNDGQKPVAVSLGEL